MKETIHTFIPLKTKAQIPHIRILIHFKKYQACTESENPAIHIVRA